MVDLELEAKILHGICSFKHCLDYSVTVVKKEHFSESMNRKIYELIKYMYVAGKTVSLMTVYQEMKSILSKNHTKWMVIDQSYCSKYEIEYMVEKLKENYKLRELHNLALDLSNKIVAGGSVEEIVKELQDKVYSIGVEEEDTRIITPEQRATSMLTTISERMQNGNSGGICTSYARLNKAINGGFQPGELVILGAPTGKGKTAFAMNIARDTSIIQKYPLLYINTEMNETQWNNRMATIITQEHASLTYNSIATGNLAQCQFDGIVNNLDKMSNSEFYSITMPELSVSDVISVANRFKAQKDIKILIIDYVGRMETTDPKLKEYQVMRDIAKRLKTLAQRLNITVIMLAQLTEEEKLEGAKAMKNEADLFMYLQEMKEANKKEFKYDYNYFLVIDKNRNGAIGTIPLKFTGEKMLFTG